MTGSSVFDISQLPATLPVLLSVPHAGRVYSSALLAASRLPVSALGMLEDPCVDRLVERAVTAGARSITANVPRAEIDLNRAPADLDPAMVAPGRTVVPLTRRAQAGLGLVPSRLSSHGAIWRSAMSLGEFERRMATVYRPYHEAITAELADLRRRFGVAVLLDCHSMPPRAAGAARIVLGDRHGNTSADTFMRAAEQACARRRFGTERNIPYAGGEIAKRHGKPMLGVHAIQIEIDRALYLSSDMRTPGPGFDTVARLIAEIVMAVGAIALADDQAVAAE